MSKAIKLDISKTLGFVTKEEINSQAALAKKCNETLHNGSGKGNDFLGWLNLPSSITDAQLKDIEDTAKALRAKCDVILAGGLGPDNVADAIEKVRPWGVDSLTKTNLPKEYGVRGGKDIAKVKAFCENAMAKAKVE